MKTTKKVRFLFLLFLIVLGTVNLKAQITIGSVQKPRGGAVLDLSQVDDGNLGFLLPRVSLENLTDWQLRGDPNEGAGMLVYNTNPYTNGGNGIGVYIWTDAGVWEALKSNLPEAGGCTGKPDTPGAISFSFGGVRGIEVNLGGMFMASVPEVSGPDRPLFYDWGLPDGLTNSSPIGYARSRAILITGDTAKTYPAGSITVKATNACGTNDEKQSNTSAITVRVCSDVPEKPGPIEFSEDTVIFEGTFKASVPEVIGGTQIPTSYIWTLPSGLAGSSTSNTITIKGETAGTYGVGEIEVTAINDCGPSVLTSSASAVTVLDCTIPPGTPGTITLDPAKDMNNGEKFLAKVTAVSGATSYIWDIPDGLTPIDDSTTSLPEIQIMGAKAGDYTITVAAKNDCGTSASSPGASVKVLNCSKKPENAGPIKLSKDTINLYDTVTVSIEEVSGATFYTWVIPEGLTRAETRTNWFSIKLTGTKADTTYAAGTITVIAKNDCGGDYESKSTSAVTVRVCSDVPVKPDTIILTKDTINLNGTFEAFVHKVNTGTQIPTSYTWELPGGLTKISSSTKGDTIQITGAIPNTYGAGTIKVTANNDCGPSEEQTNASALTVLDCTGVPGEPGAITLSKTIVNKDSTFTATINKVDGATSYTWSIPSGLEVSAGQGTTSITYKAIIATATIAAADINVYASNACGPGATKASDKGVTVIPLCKGAVIVGGVHTSPGSTVDVETGTKYDGLISKGFSRDETKDLCVYYKDGVKGGVSWNGLWNGKRNKCEDSTYIDPADQIVKWRLPNIAELGYMQGTVKDGGGLQNVTGAAPGTINFLISGSGYDYYLYWSSHYEGTNGAGSWGYGRDSTGSVVRYANASDSDGTVNSKKVSFRVRCVRTLE